MMNKFEMNKKRFYLAAKWILKFMNTGERIKSGHF